MPKKAVSEMSDREIREAALLAAQQGLLVRRVGVVITLIGLLGGGRYLTSGQGQGGGSSPTPTPQASYVPSPGSPDGSSGGSRVGIDGSTPTPAPTLTPTPAPTSTPVPSPTQTIGVEQEAL